MAKVVRDLSVGGQSALPAGNGGILSEMEIVVDMSVQNLDSDDVIKIYSLPIGALPIGISALVNTADSVEAATVDVGLYKQSDDGVIDVDALINELAIGATGIVVQSPAAACGVTVPAYVGIAQGAGGTGATNDDAVITFKLAVLNMMPPTGD